MKSGGLRGLVETEVQRAERIGSAKVNPNEIRVDCQLYLLLKKAGEK